MLTLYIKSQRGGFYFFSRYRKPLDYVKSEGDCLKRHNGVRDYYIKDANGVIVYTTEEN